MRIRSLWVVVAVQRFFSANELRAQRRRAQFTQQDLSVALQTSKGAVQQWEAGVVEPRLSTFLCIVAVLDCRMEDLLIPVVTDDEAAEATSSDAQMLEQTRAVTRASRGS